MVILFFTFPIIMVMSLLFMRLKHPLSMGLVLLCQTCLVCISSGLVSSSFWFSYILFLVFLGGMLVLFIYVASLASNEPFVFSFMSVVLIVMMILLSFVMLLLDPLVMSPKVVIAGSGVMEYFDMLTLVSMIYSMPVMGFTLYMVMYLLLTLFAVVKITGSYFGPLRLKV